MSLYPGRKMPANEMEWREWCDGQKFDFEGGAINGWDDYTADLSAGKLPAANSPTWGTFRNGIGAYGFAAGAEESIFITFHIRHDYAEGTPVYFHVHWAPNTTSTGDVIWGVEYTVAKGHGQMAFAATTAAEMTHTISSDSQYYHMITEMSDAQAFDAYETDSLVLCRIYRAGDDVADTFPDTVYAFTADLHYRANKVVTPNKSPPFY